MVAEATSQTVDEVRTRFGDDRGIADEAIRLANAGRIDKAAVMSAVIGAPVRVREHREPRRRRRRR